MRGWPAARRRRSSAGRIIESCRALGVSPCGSLLRHVLPNSITPRDRPGVARRRRHASSPRPRSRSSAWARRTRRPEWGLMVSQGQPYFTTQWWLVTFPGVGDPRSRRWRSTCVGDGLRDCSTRDGWSGGEARGPRPGVAFGERRVVELDGARRRRRRDRRARRRERLGQVDDRACGARARATLPGARSRAASSSTARSSSALAERRAARDPRRAGSR